MSRKEVKWCGGDVIYREELIYLCYSKMRIVFKNVCDMFWILFCLEVPVLDENRPKTEKCRSSLFPYKQFGVETK